MTAGKTPEERSARRLGKFAKDQDILKRELAAANRECVELRSEVMRLRSSPDSRILSDCMRTMLDFGDEAAELKEKNDRLQVEIEKLRAMAAHFSTPGPPELPKPPRFLQRLRAIAKLRWLT